MRHSLSLAQRFSHLIHSFIHSQSACARYYANLAGLQSRVAKRLGQHFAALRNHPFQLLHELQRYSGIVRLDVVRKELCRSEVVVCDFG